MRDLFNLPKRSVKPRNAGITMMLDSGLSPQQVENTLDGSVDYIDYVKLGWGTSVITPGLKEKVALYTRWGIPVCLGGTLFELAVLQNKVAELLDRAEVLGIKMIEVSDGSIDIEHQEKLDAISSIAERFIVLSEFGSKDDLTVVAPRLWVKAMKEELEAGAWKVIAEGRESGTVGLYRQSKEIRTGLVDELTLDISPDDILWEAPLKDQQAWFVEKFGANVNLGNISPETVIGVETLRLGLRSDTISHFHGVES
ncbi:MAG: phosphosulfolactate synthase [endosymbiont of Escarpia spicata]|uniref:Phosphosulfolactate synthase n=1 Tax=endosymbiont of Escarpia spicata TaxID=2200908 RepID=A0A370DER7_9GAMM|nr:MAG: phosphosulfolactate synthase [endosymbiont of Escarpia spicata]